MILKETKIIKNLTFYPVFRIIHICSEGCRKQPS
nr:MAG TPA: hypothetical protein [Bacteriophage sp.]